MSTKRSYLPDFNWILFLHVTGAQHLTDAISAQLALERFVLGCI